MCLSTKPGFPIFIKIQSSNAECPGWSQLMSPRLGTLKLYMSLFVFFFVLIFWFHRAELGTNTEHSLCTSTFSISYEILHRTTPFLLVAISLLLSISGSYIGQFLMVWFCEWDYTLAFETDQHSAFEIDNHSKRIFPLFVNWIFYSWSYGPL